MSISHPSLTETKAHPEKENGYICYQYSHWIALRKINGHWFNLNSLSSYISLQPQPVCISDFYLSAQMSKLQNEGFHVYVIRGQFPTLGRRAQRSSDLQGEFQWYQIEDVSTHVQLDKQSRMKQDEECANALKFQKYGGHQNAYTFAHTKPYHPRGMNDGHYGYNRKMDGNDYGNNAQKFSIYFCINLFFVNIELDVNWIFMNNKKINLCLRILMLIHFRD